MTYMRNVGREGCEGKDTTKDPFSSMNIQRQGQQERFELYFKMGNARQKSLGKRHNSGY